RSYGDWSSDVCSSDLFAHDSNHRQMRAHDIEQAPIRMRRHKRQGAAEKTFANRRIQVGGIENVIDQHLEAALIGRATDPGNHRRSEERRVGKAWNWWG